MVKSVVTQVGPLALSFEEEKVIILFGPSAPEELKEVSVIQEIQESGDEPISAGDTLQIGEQEYKLVKVGSSAYKNLLEIGHISIYFSEAPDEVLPGSIYVTPDLFPIIKEGDTILFTKK
ncbi:PTS glucitol/sorbitol transporter subunit IIA [Ammoniphilus sp. 3BR4]|uniref:PTS glucitol/sorbitol transporter subunit IIA n=1 Tax=Ammoniphilus sp. 3BR4 TaxID=3158265 RepID=UPI0034669F34